MSKRQVYIDSVGPVTITKRRGNTNLRLSIKNNGEIKLSMPYWTPYYVGERFIKGRRAWLFSQLQKQDHRLLQHGDQIGKSHRLYFLESSSGSTRNRVTATEIFVYTNLDHSSKSVQAKAVLASEKALKMQSEKLVAIRLIELSKRHNLPYKGHQFRKLSSRWGSCSTKKTIAVSTYLVQLPWELVDYVLLHELSHTRYMDHSPRFWQLFEKVLPDAKARRKMIKNYGPRIMPS